MSNSTFLKGAIFLTIATFLSKIIGSVYRIPLQNIAGDEVLGIFSVVYPVYMSILIVTVAGIPLAISKLISEARAAGKDDEIYAIYKTAKWLGIIFGIVSFAIVFSFAGKISAALGGELVTYSIMTVSLTLIFAPYMAVYRGFFQGYENMIPTAISQVLEQFMRVVVVLAAAIYLTNRAFPTEVIAGGVMTGSVVGVLFSLAYLQWTFMRKKPFAQLGKKYYSYAQFKGWAKRILIVSLPICFGALTMALLNVVDSLTIPTQLLQQGKDSHEVAFLYGIYGRGQALIQIATVFASALILPLIPALTKAMTEKKYDAAGDIMTKSMTFTHLTSWPVAFGLAAVTVPINIVLFGDTLGSDVILILSISSLFTSFSVLSTGMLQGANKERAAAVVVLVFSVVKVILNIVLVATMGLVGAAISTLITYILINIANVVLLYKAVPFKWLERSHIVFAVASIVMAAVIAFIQWKFSPAGFSRMKTAIYLAGLIGIGAFVYLVLIFALRGVDRTLLQSLPFISRFVKTSGDHEEKRGIAGGGNGRNVGKGVISLLKKGLWIIVIIAMLASLPSLMTRVQVEQDNKQYDVAMPYEQFVQWPHMLEETLDQKTAFAQLKEHGLSAMSIEPVTISDLITEGVVDSVKRSEIEHLHPEAFGQLTKTNGQYLQILEPDNEYIRTIESVYNNHYAIMVEEEILPKPIKVTSYTFDENTYLFLPYEVSLSAIPLGFDRSELDLIHEAGLEVIPRLPNQFMNIQNDNHYVYDLLTMLVEEYGADTLIFTGNDVVGAGEPDELKTFATKVKELGFSIVKIDFNPQRGMDAFLRLGDLKQDVIHLFSMTLGIGNEKKYELEIEKGVRGYRERNIRILFVNPVITTQAGMQMYQHPGEAEIGYESTLQMIDELTAKIGKGENSGATPFATFSQPFFVTLLVLAGATAFLSLTGFKLHASIGVLASIGGLGLSALTILGVDSAWKGLALLVAIAGAVYAGLSVGKIGNWKQLILQYVRSMAIALTGAWLVIAMLYGPEFLVKVDEFRGVKVLAAVPVLVVGFILFASFLKKLMNEPVKYWHLALMGLVVAFLAFYVWRTGNSAMTLPYELEFRKWLEATLTVRPRTSEFLLGFPLFVLGLYLKMKNHKAAPLFITLGMLGFASMVGTFTHLHTALLISLLRTVYSIGFGLILGFVLIFLFKIIEKNVFPIVKKRWIR